MIMTHLRGFEARSFSQSNQIYIAPYVTSESEAGCCPRHPPNQHHQGLKAVTYRHTVYIMSYITCRQ